MLLITFRGGSKIPFNADRLRDVFYRKAPQDPILLAFGRDLRLRQSAEVARVVVSHPHRHLLRGLEPAFPDEFIQALHRVDHLEVHLFAEQGVVGLEEPVTAGAGGDYLLDTQRVEGLDVRQGIFLEEILVADLEGGAGTALFLCAQDSHVQARLLHELHSVLRHLLQVRVEAVGTAGKVEDFRVFFARAQVLYLQTL